MNNKNILHKQKVFLFILTIFLFSVNIISAFSGNGDGSVINPYQITNCTQLQEMNLSLSSHYKIVNNIDCSETSGWVGGGWKPVGNTSNFTGSLNGQNFNITSLWSNYNSVPQYVGLFGNLNGVVSNVRLIGATFNSITYVGGIASRNWGTINNTYVNGSLHLLFATSSSQDFFGGGIAGQNYGNITYSTVVGDTNNSWIKCTATNQGDANEYLGGLVGQNYGNINNSYSTINVYGAGSGRLHIGGLVGWDLGNIFYSYSSGYVYGYNPRGGSIAFDNLFVGGLVGMTSETSYISHSYSTGNATADMTGIDSDDYEGAGGLIGLSSGIIENCYATGNVTSTGSTNSITGGLVGENNWQGKINNSYSTGYVSSGGGRIGGLVGTNPLKCCPDSRGITNNSFWDTQTSGRATSSGGTGKNTTLMKDIRTFVDILFSSGLAISWDFVGNQYNDTFNNDFWNISSSINNGYPYLISVSPIGWSSPSELIVSLLIPTNNYYFNYTDNIYLNFMVNSSNELDTCELWGNFTGNWSKNYTWETVYSGNLTNTSLNLLDGYYLWNVWCNDSLGNSNFSLTNYTFGVDTINPEIGSNITYATSQNTIFFTTNISGANYCFYSIYDENDIINGGNYNISFNCNQLSSGTTEGYGNFTLVVDVYDLAYNYIQQNQTFTTTYIPSGGGGGTPQQQYPTNPVISSGKPVLTAGNWTIETELGGNKYQFSMIQGFNRTRNLLFENLGVSERTITLNCIRVSGEEDLCAGLTFERNSFILPVQKATKTSVSFTLKIPNNIDKGTYLINIVAMDEANNLGVITVEVKITSRISITGAVTKLFSNTERNIPYLLFFFLVAFMTGVLSHFIIFKPNKLPSALSLVVGLFFGVIFLLLPI